MVYIAYQMRVRSLVFKGKSLKLNVDESVCFFVTVDIILAALMRNTCCASERPT